MRALFTALCLAATLSTWPTPTAAQDSQVVTIHTAVSGQTVSADEADYMNEQFTGRVGMRLHLPAVANDRTGLMVVLHGWGGDFTQYDDSCQQWADLYNVITLQINYRDSGDGSPVYDFGKFQAIDVLRAMDYVLTQYTIDSKRIIGWGGSGGGDVILQTGKMAPHTFALIVEVAGITKPSTTQDLQQGYGPDPAGGWQARALGQGRSYTVPEYQVRSPQYHASLQNAPVIILHGDDDNVVSVQHAYDMNDALIQAGKNVTMHIVEGGGHAFQNAQDATENNRHKATIK